MTATKQDMYHQLKLQKQLFHKTLCWVTECLSDYMEKSDRAALKFLWLYFFIKSKNRLYDVTLTQREAAHLSPPTLSNSGKPQSSHLRLVKHYRERYSSVTKKKKRGTVSVIQIHSFSRHFCFSSYSVYMSFHKIYKPAGEVVGFIETDAFVCGCVCGCMW